MTKLTAPEIRAYRVKDGKPPLVMVTAYDAPSARIAEDAGVDLLLVGDSLAMVILGYEDTLQVTVEDIAHHTAAVARTRPSSLVIADLPWMSYHISTSETLMNAAKLIRAGAQAVKLEGGRKRLEMIDALVSAEIPVMGHIGLTPQSVNAIGGFRVQAKNLEDAAVLIEDAQLLEKAGVFAIVLEGIPDVAARLVTESINVPTIGIGAGPHTDGQVLVFHDLVGLENGVRPKFVRRYAELAEDATKAVSAYASDVRSGLFPNQSETYHASSAVTEEISIYGSKLNF